MTGVGRTFLIDAGGNVAAESAVDKLTTGLLDDLLANRAIPVSNTVSFSERIRSEDDSLAPPIFDVMIRPTTQVENGPGTGRAISELMMRAMTVRGIILQLYMSRPTRMTGDALDDPTRYDVSISQPGASREAFQSVARTIICTAFHINARLETRDTDVYLLTAPEGKPSDLVQIVVPTGQTTFSTSSRRGKGTLSLKSGGLMSLAGMIEMELAKPVIDETGIRGTYDIKLTWDPNTPGALEEAIRKLGLKLEPARRPIEFLTVTKVP